MLVTAIGVCVYVYVLMCVTCVASAPVYGCVVSAHCFPLAVGGTGPPGALWESETGAEDPLNRETDRQSWRNGTFSCFLFECFSWNLKGWVLSGFTFCLHEMMFLPWLHIPYCIWGGDPQTDQVKSLDMSSQTEKCKQMHCYGRTAILSWLLMSWSEVSLELLYARTNLGQLASVPLSSAPRLWLGDPQLSHPPPATSCLPTQTRPIAKLQSLKCHSSKLVILTSTASSLVAMRGKSQTGIWTKNGDMDGSQDCSKIEKKV